jgi:DNA helicase-2/ATP-dependent DNA helicase PcrA
MPSFSSTGYQSNFSHSHYTFKTNPYGRGGRGGGADRVKESSPAYAYEDEDQSTGMSLKPGMKVRHAQFGIGTVLSVEALDDDTKLVVRFTNVGTKTLRAKFARLEPA